MKELKLTSGEIAFVDDEDFGKVSVFEWRRDKTNLHVVRTTGPKKKRRLLRLHRFIMVAKAGELIDHKNGNTLDNQKDNLRRADKSTNGMNRGRQANNTSGYKGVTWHRQMNKWAAQLNIQGKHISLGLFDNKEDAAKAYDIAARKYHGEFAVLNFPS